MDVRVLNYFLMTAREENVTRAAALLHLTQPTLSRQLKGLEEELGVELFRRSNHSIYLTREGLLFRQRAQDMVNMLERAREELQQTEELAGTIAIGCSELQSMEEVADLIDRFQQAHPKVKFALHSGNNEDIKGWIEQGSIDLGLLIEPVEIGKYDFVRMTAKEEWGVLAHEDSKFASYEAIRPGDLVGTPVITILDKVVQNELANWSGEYAAKMGNKARYNLVYNAAMLAQRNHGVVICLKLNQHFDHLVYVPLVPKLTLNSVLAWRGQQPHSQVTAAFIRFVREEKMQKN
ncbi:LysR family transcriptional regulator [Levilactobacillus cerevisiae]|uniref:LysR family transcriptional regulator n=1 Tax=Levilactobacillus cerevisiae TaxID=1704076 RepID=UPI000F769AC1|nr:LysR family transcriptional regulator [Levilactobacillus cerevisiae]